MSLTSTLNKYFGYSSFREGQREIIETILSGKQVLAVLPTGGGKSICYQIPALLGNSYSIIISPLIALMKDQVDALNSKNISAAFINSSLDYSETEKVLFDIHLGKIKLLYLSPEKLENVEFCERLKALEPEYLFIDEAHCISEWGHNFRPSYRKISSFINFSGISKIAAFTATATPEVRKDIIKQLNFKHYKSFVNGFERNNLSLNVINTKHKKSKVLELINQSTGSSIIYTSTRKNAEEVAEYLLFNGIKCQYYHAGVTTEMRRILQDDFLANRFDVIVATNAFGMGIDKSDIRTIIHYNMPGSLESYYQEIGRAGRDGSLSNIYLFFEQKDKHTQEYFINSSFPTKQEVATIYELICNFGQIAIGRKNDIPIILSQDFFKQLAKTKVTDLKFNSILNILNEAGYLFLEDELNKRFTFKFNVDNYELKKYVDKLKNRTLKKVIIALLKTYGAKLFTIQSAIAPKIIGQFIEEPTETIIEQLSSLNNLGLATFEKPEFAPAVNLLKERVGTNELYIDSDILKAKLDNAKLKLKLMIDYAFTTDCRFANILLYFGDVRDDYKCGKCDNCSPKQMQQTSSNKFVAEKILETLHISQRPLKQKYLVNILIGKSNRLAEHNLDTFGSCQHYSKNDIENSLMALLSKDFINSYDNSYTLSNLGIQQFLKEEEKTKHVVEVKANDNFDYDTTLELFNKLREVRKKIALKFSQPVNYICSDELLRTIAKLKPKNTNELMNIDGFTNRMFNKIGEDLICEISDFKESKSAVSNLSSEKSLPENISSTYTLVQKGYSLKDISKLTHLPEAVVSMQIESILQYIPSMPIDTLIEKNRIKEIKKLLQVESNYNLKDLKERLPNNYSYAELRIVKASTIIE